MKKEYKMLIDNVDYTKYLQLPFSIGEKITEAYDSASIVLDFTKIDKPFRKNALVEIHILDNVFPFDGAPYKFYIADDQVVESIKNNKKVCYQHTISLIETTKKGDNIFLNAFTSSNRSNAEWRTQEASVWTNTKVDYQVTTGPFLAYDKTYTVGGSGGVNKYHYVGHWELNTRAITSLLGGVSKNIPLNTEIILPKLSFQIYQIAGDGQATFGIRESGELSGGTIVRFDGFTKYDNYNPILPVLINVYYAFNSNNFIKLGVVCFRDGKLQLLSSLSKNFKVLEDGGMKLDGFSEKGNLQIKFEVMTFSSLVDAETGYRFKNAVNGFTAYHNELSDDRGQWEFTPVKIEYGKDNFINSISVYNNQVAGTMATTVNITDDKIGGTTTTFKTLKDVMDKIIVMINPDYGSFSYEIADSLLETPVPDLTFDGIKSLSEVLFHIGRIIRSVPEIDSNNVIKFVDYTPRDNPDFNGEKEKINTQYDSSTYSSGFVSKLSNIVNVSDRANTLYSYYPGRNLWGKARAADVSSLVYTPDNAAISIENAKKGIYAIKYIKVKNYWNGGDSYSEPVDGLDLTDFCWEKSAYDALYKGCKTTSGEIIYSNTCQANCFFYKKGTNQIELSAMSENEAISIFGNAESATYQIQNAIACAIFRDTSFDFAGLLTTSGTAVAYSTLKSPDQYQFQVAYVDDYDATIKVQQFDMSSFREPFDTNYNQESQTISAYNYGITAQEEISRRGNETISITKKVYSVNKLPRLGEIISYSGSVYLADEIEYNFYEGFVDCRLSLTKDFNKINNLVGISREYRQYDISPNEKVDRNITIYDYTYLDLESYITQANLISLTKYTNIFPSNSINKRKKFPSYAVLYFKDKNQNLLSYKKFDNTKPSEVTSARIHPIIVPITPAVIGNSIALTFSMMDNFAAGSFLDGTKKKYYGNFGIQRDGGYSQEYARYVDDYGEAYQVSIYIIDPDKSLSDYMKQYPYAVSSSGGDLPESTAQSMSLWSKPNFVIYKDMNEKISFTYQLHYCTENSKIKWHQPLAKFVMYDNEDPLDIYKTDSGVYSSSLEPAYYGVYKSDFNSAKIPSASVRVLGRPSANNSGNLDEINAISVTPQDNFDGYALVLPKTMEVLFHVNEPLKKGVSFTIPKITFSHFDKIIKS